MPSPLTTNTVIVPTDVSAAVRDLTAACRAWPSPLNFHGGPDGGPVFLPPDVGQTNELCRHILDPQQYDHWLYVLIAFALLGLFSIPMWLLWACRLVRSCARLVNRSCETAPHETGSGAQDNWLLGLLPAGLAVLLAILSFGLEHRRYLNLTVGLICAIGVLSTIASTILSRKGPLLAKDIALIFGLMAGITILFALHLLFAGLLGVHR